MTSTGVVCGAVPPLLSRATVSLEADDADIQALLGAGARDPDNVAETTEHNLHVSFEVYAAPVPESAEYFRALRRELQEALLEGVILIERQHVTLI